MARRPAAVLALLLVVVAGGACAGNSPGQADTQGATVLRYDVRSRLAGRTLAQVAVRPADAAAHPPLLVLLHGRGQYPRALADEDFYSALEALGRRAPAVVLPSGGFSSYWHDRRGGRWGGYVMREVIPTAVRRLHADPRRIAIGGISMGGFGAYDLARLHPRRFCAVGGHSAAIFTAAERTAAGAFDDAQDSTGHDLLAAAQAGGGLAFGAEPKWLDDGDADPFRPADAAFAAALGVPLHSYPGRHELAYWDAHYGDYLRFYAEALAGCRR